MNSFCALFFGNLFIVVCAMWNRFFFENENKIEFWNIVEMVMVLSQRIRMSSVRENQFV
jgi:hypothetical protein